jgi:hypothetical protein
VLILYVLEWDRIWLTWLERLNRSRLRRLESTIYQLRRSSLADEYDTYVTSLSPNTPFFSHTWLMLPISPLLRASSGHPNKLKRKTSYLNLRLHSYQSLLTSGRRGLTLNMLNWTIFLPIYLQKTLPEVKPVGQVRNHPRRPRTSYAWLVHCSMEDEEAKAFSVILRYSPPPCVVTYLSRDDEGDHERPGFISHQFGITYVEEAPYIAHVCGLDPNVVTAEDMDRRNARLKCLSRPCSNFTSSWSWRNAVRTNLCQVE